MVTKIITNPEKIVKIEEKIKIKNISLSSWNLNKLLFDNKKYNNKPIIITAILRLLFIAKNKLRSPNIIPIKINL